MFLAHHYKWYLKSCLVLHYNDERYKIVFHETTPELQDQDRSTYVKLV